jgi:DNA-binding NarL/FixJ family response regulator/nitrate/nitrite-specific signal transduction histidine kinase
MPSLYFTPASISYLAEFILSVLITAYLISRLRRREKRDEKSRLLTRLHLALSLFAAWMTNRLRRREKRGAQAFLLAGFFASLTLFIGLLFLDVTLAPTPRLKAVYLENPVLGIALVLLLQFAYHFPLLSPRHKWEARIVLGLSLSYALYEVYFAVHRFSWLAQGIVDYRPPRADYALAALFVWAPLALLRQAVAADERSVHWLSKLWQPQGSRARGARNFALIYLMVSALSVVNILRGSYIVSTAFFNALMSLGILAALWLFAVTYLNTLPETTSFMVKLSGLTLTLLLAMLGAIGWAMTPVQMAAYQPALEDHQTLHFTPNAQGGYDIAPVPFTFETDLGERLSVTSRGAGRNQAVDFTFPFYGQTYSKIYITSVGLISLGQPLYHPNLQNDYGAFAGIFPLLVDLEPASGGGVYARSEAQRLVVTWDHLPALQKPEAVYTFQAILYRDGSFDFTYNGLPAPLAFDPDASPLASPWLRGVTPAKAESVELASDLSQSLQGGPQGIVQDFYMDFRKHLHMLYAPLIKLILWGSLIILVGLPLVLRSTLILPLDTLLAGLRQMDEGKLDVQLTVHYHDEVGSLTDSFNKMARRIGALVTGLETRVAERTRELETVNAQLRGEIARHEEAEAQIVENQRSLAVLEERERLRRELHDGLGQVMGYLNVEAQTAQASLKDGQTSAANDAIQRIAQMARSSHAVIRDLILDLSTPSAPSQDLFSTLEAYLREFGEKHHIRTALSVPQDAHLPLFSPAVENQVLRIIQEALSNVRKHAQARTVEVLFSFMNGQAQIIITDDGVGFDPGQRVTGPASLHVGLDVMRERAELLGGRFEVRSKPGEGAKVLISIPRRVALAETLTEQDISSIREMRVLLVDDHPLFLDGLHNLLIARGLKVIGAARDGLEAQEKARALRPDVILMDIMMPGCDGLEATRAIKAELPEIKIVMLTTAQDEEDLIEAIRSGASGYLLKSLDADEFFRLLAGLARGEAPMTPTLATRLLDEFSRREAEEKLAPEGEEELTPRQLEILKLVAAGKMYKEIASALRISEPTVKYHMGQILDRLHLESRAQAVAYARRRIIRS